jgi:clan AA aspartic protease (TIGR02281 family)
MLLCGFELLFLGFAGATAVGAKSIQALGQEGDSQPSYGEPPYGTPPQHLMPHQAQYAAAAQQPRPSGREVVLHRKGSHFHAQCAIGEAQFIGLIDTGATNCFIGESVLRKLGYSPSQLKPNGKSEFGDGTIRETTWVELPVTVQGIKKANVEVGYVHDAKSSKLENLIGLSFLDKLSGGYEFRGNTMILRA